MQIGMVGRQFKVSMKTAALTEIKSLCYLTIPLQQQQHVGISSLHTNNTANTKHGTDRAQKHTHIVCVWCVDTMQYSAQL